MTPGVLSPGYGAANTQTTDTLTAKACRVLQLTQQLHQRIGLLEDRLRPPVPAAPTAGIEKQPEHVVFALEQAEQNLQAAVERILQLGATL
jgi:hypothetical protein